MRSTIWQVTWTSISSRSRASAKITRKASRPSWNVANPGSRDDSYGRCKPGGDQHGPAAWFTPVSEIRIRYIMEYIYVQLSQILNGQTFDTTSKASEFIAIVILGARPQTLPGCLGQLCSRPDIAGRPGHCNKRRGGWQMT